MRNHPPRRIMHVIIPRTDIAEAYASAFALGTRVSDRTIAIERTGLPPDTLIEAEVLAGPGLDRYCVSRVFHPSFDGVPEYGHVPVWDWSGSPDIACFADDERPEMETIVMPRLFESVHHVCITVQEEEDM